MNKTYDKWFGFFEEMYEFKGIDLNGIARKLRRPIRVEHIKIHGND